MQINKVIAIHNWSFNANPRHIVFETDTIGEHEGNNDNNKNKAMAFKVIAATMEK